MIQWDFTKLDAKDKLQQECLCKGFTFKEHFDILGDRYIHFVADG